MATAAVQLPGNIPSGINSQQTYTGLSPSVNVKSNDRPAAPHDVNTVLNFHKDNEDGSPPRPTYVGKPETYERPVATFPVKIHDVTGEEKNYSLDSHGFQFVPHVSAEKEFVDEEAIKGAYYKETEQLLKDVTGGTRVFIFDHTIRRQEKDARNDGNSNDSQTPNVSLRGPVKRVHIDQSYTAALSRVPFHLPDLAPELLKGRVQLINVWRPIKTVRRDPLTVASSQSVEESDLVPVGLIYPTRKGETLAVRHNEKHKWFFKYRQTPQEVLLIKCFDNRAGADVGRPEKAKRVPHSAFELPGAEHEESRESIEVRALVFHENDLE